jgi:hypothetical protein
MVDYAFYIGLIRQKLSDNAALSAMVQGHIYKTAPGMLPADKELHGSIDDPNLTLACIGIRLNAMRSTTLGQVLNVNKQQVVFVVTVENTQDRDSDSYASSIIDLIQKALEGDIYQTMNNISYHIMFEPPFSIMTISDPAFPNRANASLTAQAFFIDSST